MFPARQEIIYGKPNYFQDEELPIFDKYSKFETHNVEPVVLTNVNFSWEFIFWRGLRILPQSQPNMVGIPFYDKYINRIKFIVFNHLRRRKKVLAEAFLVNDVHSSNYYHWIVEVLPKLVYISTKRTETLIILPASLQQFDYVLKTLNMFESVSVQYFNNENEYAFCRKLTVIPNFQVKSYNTPLTTSLVREFISSKIDVNAGHKGKRLYISRLGNSGRRITNEPELIHFMKERSFEIIYAETLSFEGQVQLFGNASVLIGLHGAGLTNMIFMPAKSAVLEIRNTSDPNGCYFTLAKSADLNYYFYAADTSEWAMSNMKVEVDIMKFKELVDLMLNSTAHACIS